MHLLALQTAAAEGGGQLEQIARTFGVDWTHLGAQSVSFAVMCVVLYTLAYKPILSMLEARREQIKLGLANAAKIKTELERIEIERRDVLQKAGDQGKVLIEDARKAAAAVKAEATEKAARAADEIVARAHENAERERARMLDEVKHEVGRLVMATAASVTGKILTADDQRRLAEETASQLAL
jgi:F-type H+-transporting ATPase subunit b